MNFNKLQEHKAALRISKVFYSTNNTIAVLAEEGRTGQIFFMEITYLYMN